MAHYSKAIIIISGFTERRFEDIGSSRLYEDLKEIYGSKVPVFMCEWNENFQDLADNLNRKGVKEIVVGAYSWGAGNGLSKLSKHFKGQIYAVLCDPVYRSKFPWMRWRAMTNWLLPPVIKYPSNVTVVHWFSQRSDKPQGHKVLAGKMIPHKPKILPYTHGQIDDSPHYSLAVDQTVKSYLKV